MGCRPNCPIPIDEDVYNTVVADRVRIADLMLIAGEFARLRIEPQQPRGPAEPKTSFFVLGNTMNGFCPAIPTSFVNDKPASRGVEEIQAIPSSYPNSTGVIHEQVIDGIVA